MPVLRINGSDSNTGPYIRRCLEEAGGEMELEDLLFKFQQRFNFRPFIYTDEEVERLPMLQGLKIEDGKVRLPKTKMRVVA